MKKGNGHNDNGQKIMSKSRTIKKPEYSNASGLSEKSRAWLNERGITDEVLERNHRARIGIDCNGHFLTLHSGLITSILLNGHFAQRKHRNARARQTGAYPVNQETP